MQWGLSPLNFWLMNLPSVKYCPGNLSPVKNGTYCLSFRKDFFQGARVSHILDFSSPGQYISRPEDVELIKHLSISGVQSKFSVRQDGQKLRKVATKGEFILKPIPAGVPRAGEVPANEHLTMQLANQVYGILTARNGMIFYADGEPAYMCKRFDRKDGENKFRQEDFAQVAERSAETHGQNYKYEFSYEDVALLMQKYIPAFRPEIEKFFRLVVFNYLFSNGDAHLKNFSLIETTDGDYVLSPAYDLLCTRLHSPLERDMAPVNGLFNDYNSPSFDANGFYAYDDFYDFGIHVGILPNRVRRFLEFFITDYKKVSDLVSRSFLSNEAKAEYLNFYRDKLKRLKYSFAGTI